MTIGIRPLPARKLLPEERFRKEAHADNGGCLLSLSEVAYVDASISAAGGDGDTTITLKYQTRLERLRQVTML